MTSRIASAFLAALALVFGLSGNAQFRYQAALPPVPETGFYAIPLTPELSRHLQPDLSDLRIVDERRQWVPYYIDAPHERNKEHLSLTELPVKYTSHSGQTTILEIENSGKKERSDLVLVLKNASASRVASLAGSENAKDWFAILDSLQVKPAEQYADSLHHQLINFPVSSYRYYKLTILNNDKRPLNILKVTAPEFRPAKPAIDRFFFNTTPKIYQTDSGHYSVFKIVHNEPTHISMIRITVNRPLFHKRTASVFTPGNAPVFSPLHAQGNRTFVMSSDAGREHAIPLVKTDTLFLQVENGDNPPLVISSIETAMPGRLVIAHLERGKSYSLLLGHPGATAPRYELEEFKNRIGSYHFLNAGKAEATAFEQTLGEKPAKQKWIVPAIGAVILVLSWLTWQLTAEMRKNATSQNM